MATLFDVDAPRRLLRVERPAVVGPGAGLAVEGCPGPWPADALAALIEQLPAGGYVFAEWVTL